jgi:NAD+ diphosphatase
LYSSRGSTSKEARKLQDEELSAGAFYNRNNLPEIPKKLSIARQLIDAWLDNKI